MDLVSDVDGLDDSDFVLVSTAALAEAAEPLCHAIIEWLDLAGRQPLVVWEDQTGDLRTAAAAVINSADFRLDAGQVLARVLSSWFGT